MTFPMSRQGLEQIALLLAVGALVFGLLALLRWRRGQVWRPSALSGGALIAVAAVALGVGYTLASNIPTPPVPFTARFVQNPTPNDAATVEAGRATYQRHCASCHGPQARGDGPAAFALRPRPVDLQVHVPQHAEGEVFYWISEGVRGTAMPDWKETLSENERWQIVRYLQALAAGAAQ